MTYKGGTAPEEYYATLLDNPSTIASTALFFFCILVYDVVSVSPSYTEVDYCAYLMYSTTGRYIGFGSFGPSAQGSPCIRRELAIAPR